MSQVFSLSNYFFNPYAIAHFVVAHLILVWGIFVLAQNKKSLINVSYFLISFNAFLWLAFESMVISSKTLEVARFWAKALYIGVSLLPPSMYFFSVAWLDQLEKKKKWVVPTYLVGLSFIIFSYLSSDEFIGARKRFFGFYDELVGFSSVLYLVFFFVVSGAFFWNLIQGYRKENIPIKKLHIRRVLIAFVFAFLIGSSEYLTTFGLELYPIGFVGILILILVTAHAVLRYRLMDIEVVIRRTLLYVLLVGFISIVSLVTVILTERWFQRIFGYQALGSTILAAIFIAFAFQPFKQRLENWIARYLFRESHLELVRQNERLQQQLRQSEKLAAIGKFAAAMVHEIRNPLSAIQSFAEYFPHRQRDPAFLSQFQQVLSRELGRLNSLISRVLGFAKSEELKLELVNLHSLLDETLELLGPKLKNAGIRLTKLYANQDHAIVRADSGKLAEVLLNLIMNSIEAMSGGGELTIQTQRLDAEICMRILDGGCGMTEEQLTHLFEPFYTTKTNGTGLGMNIVKSIVEVHKGKITVTSQIGKGTVVEIRLPMNENQSDNRMNPC